MFPASPPPLIPSVWLARLPTVATARRMQAWQSPIRVVLSRAAYDAGVSVLRQSLSQERRAAQYTPQQAVWRFSPSLTT